MGAVGSWTDDIAARRYARRVVDIRVLHSFAPGDVEVVRRLSAAAAAADGHPTLGEAVWRDLDRGGAGSAGVLALAPPSNDPVGYAHVAPNDNFMPPHWAVGTVVHPDHRDDGVERALLEAVGEQVARSGGGRIVLWVFDPAARDDAVATRAGFARSRDLLQLRVPLPLAERPAWPPSVEVRSFVPGRDEAAWLTVNNRAFDNHPEQGEWIEETLRRREAEPWFDPAGFLLAFDDQGLAGFCWTKIHADDQLGEIFVIGVDPSRQGTGLGRALCVAGLASIAARGVHTGMLFVDSTNDAALALYRALGFETHRLDRAYEREVAPA